VEAEISNNLHKKIIIKEKIVDSLHWLPTKVLGRHLFSLQATRGIEFLPNQKTTCSSHRCSYMYSRCKNRLIVHIMKCLKVVYMYWLSCTVVFTCKTCVKTIEWYSDFIVFLFADRKFSKFTDLRLEATKKYADQRLAD
jgi:hypothetical protein